MRVYFDWISEQAHLARIIDRLRLLENFYQLPTSEYDALFNNELERLIQRVDDAAVRKELEQLRDFSWTSYIAAAVRNSIGTSDQRAVQEATHDIVSRLLTGKLFSGWDWQNHGPLEKRFKRSKANLLRNMAEKERNHRRYIPSVPIGTEFRAGGVTPDELPGRQQLDGEEAIEEFRKLVRDRLGGLALAILDLRLDGESDTKSLVRSEEFGRPSSYRIKQTVQEIKQLAREFAAQRSPGFLTQFEKAMAGEQATLRKRFAAKAS